MEHVFFKFLSDITFKTRENDDNGRKLQKLLQRSDSALLKIFHRHFPEDPEDLYKVLNVHRLKIKRLRHKSLFYKGDFDLILPNSKGSPKKTFSQKFDSPLIVKLLKHFVPDVKKPSNGWDKIPDEADETEEAHMVRLVICRNKVQHGSRYVELAKFKEIAEEMIVSLVALGEDKRSFDDILPPLRYKIQPPVANFSFREEEMKEIHDIIVENSSKDKLWFVIQALAGTGKSEMARKYAEEYWSYYGGNCVWIKSSSQDFLEKAFAEIAECCELQTKDEFGNLKGIDYIIRKVHEHFKIDPFLYIFDDVVNIMDVQSFLPKSLSSVSLITTQIAEWPDEFEVIELKMFNVDESSKFLFDSIKVEHKEAIDSKTSGEIFDLLGGQPMALQQFVTAINNSKGSLEKFITAFIKKRGESLNLDISLPKLKVSAIAAININIERLRMSKNTELATEILETAVYLDITEISMAVFEMLFSDYDILDISNAIHQLHLRSLVIERDKLLSIHSLVKEAILIKHNEMECSNKYIANCMNTFDRLDDALLWSEPWYKHLIHLRYTTKEDIDNRVMKEFDKPFLQNALVG